MAITVGNTSGGGDQVSSWSHTCQANTTLLVVVTRARDTSPTDIAVSDITYNGVSGFTKARAYYDATFDYGIEVWYYLNPPTGSSYTIAVTFGGSVSDLSCSAIDLKGTATISPVDSYYEGSVQTTGITETINPAATGSYIVGGIVVGTNGTGNFSISTGSEFEKIDMGSYCASTAHAASSGTTATISWTSGSSYEYSGLAITFKPAPPSLPLLLDFESGSLTTDWIQSAGTFWSASSSSPLSGAYSLLYNSGGSASYIYHYNYNITGGSYIYASFIMKTSVTFSSTNNTGFYISGGTSTDFLRVNFLPTYYQIYVYNESTPTNYTSSQISFTPGNIYRVEILLKKSSSTSAKDGEITVWVNGTQQWNQTSVDIFDNWIQDSTVRTYCFQNGGSFDVRYDNIYLSTTPTRQDNQPAYLKGGVELTDNQPAYLKGGVELTDNQPAYMVGGLIVANNQPVHMVVEGIPLYPDSDNASTGSWTNETFGISNLYLSINETGVPDDNDYVMTAVVSSGDYYEVTLENPASPITSETVSLIWRARAADGIQVSLKLELREGVNIRAVSQQTVTDSFDDYSYVLTDEERNSVANWDNITLRFTYMGEV